MHRGIAIHSYSLTTNKVGQGSISRSPNRSNYAHGTIVTITATPSSNWRFVGWSGDTTATANPLVIAMVANRTLTATFVEAILPVVTVCAQRGELSGPNHGACDGPPATT